MRRANRWFVPAVVVLAWMTRGFAGEDARPPATVRLEAYIQAFNSGSEEAMRTFLLAHYSESALKELPLEQRLARYAGARARLRSFELEKILAERARQTFALVRVAGGQHFLLRAVLEKEPPHKLQAIALEAVDDPDNIVLPEPKGGEEEFAAAVREFFQERTRADEFSGVVLVAVKDRVVFHEAFGDADREKKIPNRKDTKFNLGSINKSFTRAAILQLARRGSLSLDDRIGKHLPDYPNRRAAEKVTIRHLLEMTSGIGDFFGPRFQATPKERIRAIKDYLPLFADLPLEFEPGTSSRYSNGGYIVLGAIIEKVTGLDYHAYVRENIFKPCGMQDTDAYERDADVPNLARGYTRRAAGGERILNHDTLPGRGSSAGGGYSTAEDLLRYVRALKSGVIFLPDTAAGLGIAGGAPGINSILEWDPSRETVIIVLTNFDPPTAGDAARRIANWLPED